jgi:predicted RNA polymerase sigma factor
LRTTWIGAFVGRAAAVAEAQGPEAGWRLLETVPRTDVESYQPSWALAAHILKSLGRASESVEAYELAIGLSEDNAVRDFLRRQMP